MLKLQYFGHLMQRAKSLEKKDSPPNEGAGPWQGSDEGGCLPIQAYVSSFGFMMACHDAIDREGEREGQRTKARVRRRGGPQGDSSLASLPATQPGDPAHLSLPPSPGLGGAVSRCHSEAGR